MILSRYRYRPITVPLPFLASVTHSPSPFHHRDTHVPHRPSPSFTVPHRPTPSNTVYNNFLTVYHRLAWFKIIFWLFIIYKDYFLTIFHRNKASVACMSFEDFSDLFKPSNTYFFRNWRIHFRILWKYEFFK